MNFGKLSKVEIGNEKKKGQIKIIKTSEDDNTITGTKAGTPIKNVEFEIRDSKGKVIEKIITDENGQTITSKLEIGKYIIKEIKTDENYYLDETEYVIEIQENDEIKTLNVTNKSKIKLPRTGF